MKSTKLVVLGMFALGLVTAIYLINCDRSNKAADLLLPTPPGGSRSTVPIWLPATMNPEQKRNPDTDGERTNSIDRAGLVFVSGGEFQMGASAVETVEFCKIFRDDCQVEDFSDEEPVHTVSLPGFWIYRHEVSNELYRRCVDQGSCRPPAITDFYNDKNYSTHPVVYVDWYSAENYCVWAGGRLPTEAEWEKAAHGDDDRHFPWGEEVNCQRANYKTCYVEMTNPIYGLTAGASSSGVINLAGNVSEWTEDWYAPDYYVLSPNFNPAGSETGEFKVIRGGSWKNPVFGLRITNRVANFPEIFSAGIGFRCVIEGE